MARRESAVVEQALERIEKEKVTPYRAARDAKIALSTIYRAMKRRKMPPFDKTGKIIRGPLE